MLKDLKTFLLRGNVVDLAVAVVIALAFGDLVEALIADIITPVVSIPGGADFSGLEFTVNGSVFRYGHFINAVIAFLTVAATVFTFVVQPVNALMNRRKTEPDVERTTRECPECLSSIPVAARRCAFCTAEVAPAA
ncbi:MAG TPA: large conductance mechanosensitive channel protein MscL [Acidimicrobiales bacterium]|nr:large conductance mechanosensitive channel protein MscL [Acidimicrobiales bacterium]